MGNTYLIHNLITKYHKFHSMDDFELFYQQSYTQRIAVRAVVINDENEILLQKMVLPKGDEQIELWSIPGGIVDKNESLIDAMKRETFEETGVVIEPECVLGIRNWFKEKSWYPNDPYSHQGTDIIFGARYISGDFKPQIEEGIELIKFFNKEDFSELDLNTQSPIVENYERYLQGKGIPVYPPRTDVRGYTWRYDIY
ncbi:MAG: NUDIX hydrolase [Candidatus Heimdallarchaeota archaeon]|nr:NUDIX hydrolase [Candidatus Heimdallarchaeota archaeon]